MTFEMQNKDTVSYTKYRNSNLELFRILLMLMIIAHHYVVNSGLTEVWSVNDETGNSLFLALFGWGGKRVLIALFSLRDILCVKRISLGRSSLCCCLKCSFIPRLYT